MVVWGKPDRSTYASYNHTDWHTQSGESPRGFTMSTDTHMVTSMFLRGLWPLRSRVEYIESATLQRIRELPRRPVPDSVCTSSSMNFARLVTSEGSRTTTNLRSPTGLELLTCFFQQFKPRSGLEPPERKWGSTSQSALVLHLPWTLALQAWPVNAPHRLSLRSS